MQVKVTVYKEKQWSKDWPSENLIQYLAFFNEKLRLIPKEYQNSAQITIEGILGFDDDSMAKIEIFYLRSLTKEEVAKMKAREEENDRAVREYELKELKRLTKKYN